MKDKEGVIAVLEDEETTRKIIAQEIEEDLKREEHERQAKEEEERQRKIKLAEEERKRKEQEEAQEIEQQSKWNELLSSLVEFDVKKETTTKPTSVNETIPELTVTKEALTTPKPETASPDKPTTQGPSSQSTSPLVGSTDRKPFIGDTMRDVLCDLAEKLGEPQLIGVIKSEFGTFVKQAGDTSRQLSKFLQHVLKEDSKVAKVLKAITQSIIASPFIRLKYAFQKVPFEDLSGKWKIIVSIVPGEEIVVLHQKAGISKDGPPISGFEFQWELRMRFDWNMTSLTQATLVMNGVTYQHGISDSARKEIQHIVDTFNCK